MNRTPTFNIVRIPFLYLRVSVMHEIQYRAHMLLQLMQTTVSMAAGLAGVGVVFSHGNSLNGWTAPELLIVVALFKISFGIIATIVQPSLKLLMEQVRKGTLDFTLLKPVDSQLLASVQRMDPWKLLEVIAGCILLVIAVNHSDTNMSLESVAKAAITFSAGVCAIYSAWIALATLVFWFMRAGELLDIAHSIFDGGRWPVSLYPSWLKYGLTFVIPAGFAVSLPAESILGEASWLQVSIACAYTALSLILTRLLWKFALRHYSGASA